MSVLPLPGQSAIWYESQLTGGPESHHSLTLRVESNLDLVALQRAYAMVVERHDALRSRLQVGNEGLRVDFTDAVADVELLPDVAALADPSRRSMLSTDAALRVSVVRAEPESTVLVVAVKASAADRWSLPVIVHELGEVYRSLCDGRAPDLPPVPAIPHPPTATVAELDRLAYRLRDLPTTLEFVPDRSRPAVRTRRRGRVQRQLDSYLRASIEAYAHRHQIAPASVLAAAFEVALHRYTGQERFMLGELCSMRGDGNPDTVGCLGNLVLVDADLRDDPTFANLSARVERARSIAAGDANVPFAAAVARLAPVRDLSRHPVVQAAMVHDGDVAPQLEWDSQPQLNSSGMPFEISFETRWSDLTTVALAYNIDLFETGTADAMLETTVNALQDGLRAPHVAISAHAPVAAVDRRLVSTWTAAPVDFGECDLIPQALARQSQTRPTAVAVSMEGKAVTFAELGARVDSLAWRLIEAGVTPGSIVAVALERSIELVVALFAALKVGAAYLPLDPEYPPDRLAFMMDDARPVLILSQPHVVASLPATDVTIMWLGSDTAAQRPDAPPVKLLPEMVAYVIYTSGSTGRPKGVQITHGALRNRIAWMQETFHLTPADRVLQKTPSSFDVSVWEFFWAAYAGARLVMARPGGHRDVEYLAEVIRREQVTVIHFVPSVLRLFLAEPTIRSCTSLRLLFCSGEALPADLINEVLSHLDCQLHNLYGPTEATVDVTWWPCTTPSSPVPIGHPIANTTIQILDTLARDRPVGAIGEICIGGAQVGAGYLHRPRLTAERFLPDPGSLVPGAHMYRTGDFGRYRRDGAIEYLGRRDDQIKLHGTRVELGEIESSLVALSGVKAAAVIAVPRGTAMQLEAFVVVTSASAIAPADLVEPLTRQLPPHMIPSRFTVIDDLPMSPSGKADRAALARMATSLAESTRVPRQPATTAQQVIARAFEEVTGREVDSVDADFFRLGGDSIRTIELQTRLRQEGFGVSLADIVQTSTVDGLALAATELLSAQDRNVLAALHSTERAAREPAPTIEQRIASQAHAQPDAPAVRLGQRRWSYAELTELIDRRRAELSVPTAYAETRTVDILDELVTSLVRTRYCTSPPASPQAIANVLRDVEECLRWRGRREVLLALGSPADVGPALHLGLATGARLELPSPDELADPTALAALADRCGATTIAATAQMFDRLVNAGWIGDPAARIVVIGGPVDQAAREPLLARGRVLWSVLGPREFDVWTLAIQHQTAEGADVVVPLADARLYVLDETAAPVPVGVPGRLWMSLPDIAKRPYLLPTTARIEANGALRLLG